MGNLNPVYQAVLDAFRGLCGMCKRPYKHFHEIIPKSRDLNPIRKDNVIPLCVDCHTEVHRVGASNYREKLQKINDEVFRNLQGQSILHLVQVGETLSDEAEESIRTR